MGRRAEIHYICCVRVKVLPQPYVSSSVYRCCACAERVWVSDGVMAEVAAVPICLECLEEKIDAERKHA